MRILVTGGAGFIGANLCKKLLEQRHDVVAVDNLITGDKINLKDFFIDTQLTFIKHDVTRRLPKQVTTGPIHAIYHLACPTGVTNLLRLGEEMMLTSSWGTQNLLELARVKRARFLLASSSEVYGNPGVSPQREDYTGNVDPTGVRSPYEEGKRFAESWVSLYVRKYKLDGIIVRIFNTYGPGMSPHDKRVIPTFLRQALSGQPLTVHGRGGQRRTFCYVDDLVGGLITLMHKGKTAEVYNLGSDREIKILDLARLILKISGAKSKIKFIKRPTHDPDRRLPSLLKAKRLGWRPNTDLRNGLIKTQQWFG